MLLLQVYGAREGESRGVEQTGVSRKRDNPSSGHTVATPRAPPTTARQEHEGHIKLTLKDLVSCILLQTLYYKCKVQTL